MGGIFINYRRLDNPLGAAGIYDALVRRFGGNRVFRDCVTVEAGRHYPSEIRHALETAAVLVAVIGPKWLILTDPATGERLIDRDHDWVRHELATAFQRNIHVIPVLLTDMAEPTRHPTAGELPDDLKPLAKIQAFDFSHNRFTADLNRLATLLAPFLAPTNGTRLPATDFAELVTALEAVPCMSNDDTRTLIINQLRPAISGNIPHYPQRRPHVMGILRTCLDYERGLAELITAMRSLEQSGSIPFQDLIATLSRLLPEAVD